MLCLQCRAKAFIDANAALHIERNFAGGRDQQFHQSAGAGQKSVTDPLATDLGGADIAALRRQLQSAGAGDEDVARAAVGVQIGGELFAANAASNGLDVDIRQRRQVNHQINPAGTARGERRGVDDLQRCPIGLAAKVELRGRCGVVDALDDGINAQVGVHHRLQMDIAPRVVNAQSGDRRSHHETLLDALDSNLGVAAVGVAGCLDSGR